MFGCEDLHDLSGQSSCSVADRFTVMGGEFHSAVGLGMVVEEAVDADKRPPAGGGPNGESAVSSWLTLSEGVRPRSLR
jgi:hypothetical protein